MAKIIIISFNPYSTVTFTCTSFALLCASTVTLRTTSSVNHVFRWSLSLQSSIHCLVMLWNVGRMRTGHVVGLFCSSSCSLRRRQGSPRSWLEEHSQYPLNDGWGLVLQKLLKFSDQWKYIFLLVIIGNTSLIFLLNKAIIEINIYYDQNDSIFDSENWFINTIKSYFN